MDLLWDTPHRELLHEPTEGSMISGHGVGNWKLDYSNLGGEGAPMNKTSSSANPALQAGIRFLSPCLRSRYLVEPHRE